MMTRAPTLDELARALAYINAEFAIKNRIGVEQWAAGLAYGQKRRATSDDIVEARAIAGQLPEAAWIAIAMRADELISYEGGSPRYTDTTGSKPGNDAFRAAVVADHMRTAEIEAKRAYHYATQFPGVRFSDLSGAIALHAARAGERAAYSGIPLDMWAVELAREFAIPTIKTAFVTQFTATSELLATPEDELEEDGPEENPGRSWSSSQVQSLLFDKERWGIPAAKKWAKDHGFRYGQVDDGPNYIHLRQFDPIRGRPCRTVTWASHQGRAIKARVCSG
jgi:hypothetical protein